MRWLVNISDPIDSLLKEFEKTLGDSEGQGGRPGVLRSMGSQRVGHNLATEQVKKSLEKVHLVI